MRFYPDHRDTGPLRYIGQVPVYATTLLCVLSVAGLVLTTLLLAANGPVEYFVFSSEQFFRHGWLWQIVTCTFVNGPSIYYLIWLYLIFSCGLEIERFFGRRMLLTFYVLQTVVIALVLGTWRLAGVPGEYRGIYGLSLGFFVGYATLYPELSWFGLIPMKFVAGAYLAIVLMQDLAGHAWQELTVMLAIGAVGFGFVRYAKLGGSLEFGDWASKLNPFRRGPRLRVMPTPPDAKPPRVGAAGGNITSVDAILDKIARDGFASLTQDERDQLEKAREILNKKRG